MQILKDSITYFLAVIVAWLSLIPAPFTSKYENVLYLTLVFFLVLSFSCRRRAGYFIDNEFDKLIWLFLIWNLFSALFAYNKNIAFERYIDFAIPFIVIYFLAKNELDNKRIWLIIYTLFFSAIVVSIIGILEFIYNKNIIYERFINNLFYRQYVNLPRVMSTMVHPTILGTYLMLCLPASYFVIENLKNKIKRLLAIIGIFLIVMCLMFTFSRTAWFVAAVITIFYFYKKNRKTIFLPIIFIILFLCASVAVTKFKPTLYYRVDYKNIVNYLLKGHRAERYPLTIKILKDYPFTGVGPNNYRLVFDKYYGSNRISYNIKIPDNMYLMVAGETGLIGIGLFIILLFYITRRGFILLRERKGKDWRIILVIFSSLIGVLMHMISYDLFYWVVPYFLFLLFLGGLASYSNNK